MTPYLIFFLAGLGFGFAASGPWVWLPLLVPLGLGLLTAAKEGVDGTLLLRLLIALLVTAAGVVLGTLLDRRGQAGRPRPA